MYCLKRKNNEYRLVKDKSEIGPDKLIKSIFSPKWYNSAWKPPSATDKKIWTNFLKKGRIDDPRFNPQIEQSWLRCRNKEVDPTKVMCEKYLPVGTLERRSENLIALANPIMDTLFHCVRESEFVIVLIDSHGHILRTVGGVKELRHAERLGFGPGADWSEESVGTNAIGTALVLGHPVQVTGTEHFCESHHLWTCSTAPIRDRDGKIIGFLDISGPRERATAHQLGLIVAAAHAIEERIVLDESIDKLYDSNKYLEALLNSVSDAIIAVNGQGIVTGINNIAAKALRCHPVEIMGKTINAMLQNSGKMQNFFRTKATGRTKEEVVLKMSGGQTAYAATANPVFSDKGDSRGFVLTFSPQKKYNFAANPAKENIVKFGFADIIGESKAIRQSIKMAKSVAPGPSSVLVLGESGTGKELFAQAIHNASDYRKGPFVSVNCGAIPKDLVQSELFGYQEGAFTGARRGGAAGKFEMANGGTLFLDEIGEMPFEMQVNLLRVLEERAITPVGAKKAIPVEVRIIAATNKSLFEEVSKGRFREDLYYRLNVIAIALPPLRTRKEDIPPLARYFVEKISRKVGKTIENIDPGVLETLEKYHWPGNVRELVNALEHAVNFSPGEEILVQHLPAHLRENASKTPQPSSGNIMSLADAEKEAIEKALRFFSGNITQASKALGIGRNTLYDKIRKYGIG